MAEREVGYERLYQTQGVIMENDINIARFRLYNKDYMMNFHQQKIQTKPALYYNFGIHFNQKHYYYY